MTNTNKNRRIHLLVLSCVALLKKHFQLLPLFGFFLQLKRDVRGQDMFKNQKRRSRRHQLSLLL